MKFLLKLVFISILQYRTLAAPMTREGLAIALGTSHVPHRLSQTDFPKKDDEKVITEQSQESNVQRMENVFPLSELKDNQETIQNPSTNSDGWKQGYPPEPEQTNHLSIQIRIQ